MTGGFGFVHGSGPAPGNAVGFACFSPDRRYRWELRRAWPGGGWSMTWIMLNPSAAGVRQDDATIRRCRGLAERAGRSSIDVVNLFAPGVTGPGQLRTSPRGIGRMIDFAADITARARWARAHNNGHPEPAWSTGERLAVRVVLGDQATLDGKGYTRQEAVQRLSGEIAFYGYTTGVEAWITGVRAAL